MRLYTTDLYGRTLIDPSDKERRRVLLSVLEPDSAIDYPDVYLSHSTGVTLIYRQGGTLIRETETGDLYLMTDISPARAEEIWNLLAKEKWADLQALPWVFDSSGDVD